MNRSSRIGLVLAMAVVSVLGLAVVGPFFTRASAPVEEPRSPGERAAEPVPLARSDQGERSALSPEDRGVWIRY